MERILCKILVVEDEEKIREVILAYLKFNGYDPYEAIDGQSALQEIEKQSFDLIILDLMLPDINGKELCKRIRIAKTTPIIMLTAKSSDNNRNQGLLAGADDYIVKPFDPHELISRIRSVLVRANNKESLTVTEHVEYNDGRLIVNSRTKQVLIGQAPIQITPSEYKLLIALVRNSDKTFSREELIEKVMGVEFEGETRTIDQHVKNLRQKIEKDPKNPNNIRTVIGTGYRFHGGNN